MGYSPFFLCVIHKEGLCPSRGDINRLMMINLRNLTILSVYFRKPAGVGGMPIATLKQFGKPFTIL
jgi:hypothetical protein